MTITSNIHVGLAGWSNATYAVGARRSNGGQAYQVTTAGTSTAPPSGTGTNIAPGGTAQWKWLSSIDYSTLQAWADAIPATLTQPIVGLVWNDGAITPALGVTILTLSGHSTTSTNTITIKPAPGEGFRDKPPTTPFGFNVANGVCIQCPSSGSGGVNYVIINDNYVTFEGIQFWDPNSASNSTIMAGSGQNVTVSKCIFDGYTQPGGATIFNLVGNNILLVNCLIIDRGTSTDDTFHAYGASGVHVLYNTFYAPTSVSGKRVLDCGSNTTTASNFARNNIFANFPIPFSANSGTPWSSDHNAYTVSSFDPLNNATDTGGSVYGITVAGTFVTSGIDFRLSPTSACLNAGFADSLATDDAFGSTRPQGASPDIGAHELLAGTVIYRDMLSYSSNNRSHTLSQISGSEYLWIRYRSSQLSADWTRTAGSASSSQQIFVEILATYPPTPGPFSSDFSPDFGSGPFSLPQVSFALEFGQRAAIPIRDAENFVDWTSVSSGDLRIPREAKFSALSAAHATPSDALSTQPSLSWLVADFDPTDFNSDFGIGNLNVNPAFGIEFGFVAGVGGSSSVESSATAKTDIRSQADWLGSAVFGVSSVVGVEWAMPLLASFTASPDWSSPVVSRSSIATMDWRALVDVSNSGLLDNLTPAGMTAVIPNASNNELAGPLTAGLIEAVAPLNATTQALAEWTAPVGSQSIIPEDNAADLTLASSAMVEMNYLRDVSAAIYPAWVGIASGSISSPVDSRSSLASEGSYSTASYASLHVFSPLTSESEAAIIASGEAQSEWGHLRLTVTTDAAFSMEHLEVRLADTGVGVSLRLGRKAIGARLTPDEWEEEHDPSC